MKNVRNGSTWILLGRSAVDLLYHRRFVLAMFIVVIAARLLWVLIVQPDPVGDSAVREQDAWRLSTTGAFTTDEGQNVAFQPPGYLGLLATVYVVLGRSLLAAALVNVVLSIGVLWLTYDVVRSHHSEIAGRWTLLVLGLFPSVIAQNALIPIEPLASFLVILGVWLSLKLPTRFVLVFAFATGIIFGAAVLTRPTVVLLPAVLLLFDSRKMPTKRLLATAVILYIGLAVVVLPWTIRNNARLGTPVLVSTNGGVNFLIGNHPFATGGYVWNQYLQDQLGGLAEVDRDRAGYRVGLEYIVGHPVETVIRLPRKVWHMYSKDAGALTTIWMGLQPGTTRNVVWAGRWFAQVYYAAVLLVFLIWVGSVVFRRQRTYGAGYAALAMVVTFTGTYAWFIGGQEFHAPVVSAFAIGASMMLSSGFRRQR
jgi:4-amino-4-deoxy-L-arabinose transferase-like glycosyltransferase